MDRTLDPPGSRTNLVIGHPSLSRILLTALGLGLAGAGSMACQRGEDAPVKHAAVPAAIAGAGPAAETVSPPDAPARTEPGGTPAISGSPTAAEAIPTIAPNSLPAGLTGRLVLATQWDLTLLDLSNGGRTTLRSGRPGEEILTDPAWSPDGRTIAYIGLIPPAADDAEPFDRTKLRLIDTATGQEQVLLATEPSVLLSEPAWSPDGESIYLTRTHHRFAGLRYEGSEQAIHRFDRSDGSRHEIVAEATSPAPAPSGDRLAFVSLDPRVRKPGVWAIDLASGATEPILTTSALLFRPAYAPDGSAIAFAAADPEGDLTKTTVRPLWEPPVALAHGTPADIWLVAPDGSNLRRLTTLDQDAFLPAWSPDGRVIATLGQSGLYFFDRDGPALAQVTEWGSDGALAWGGTPRSG